MSETDDRMSEIQKISARIKNWEATIASREAIIKMMRRKRAKLVAKRYRLQIAAGLK